MGVERTFQSDYILIFFNFEKNVSRFRYKDISGLKLFFDSSAAHRKANRKENPAFQRTEEHIVMSPESVIIFES